MIELASEKMPNAHLYQGTFQKSLSNHCKIFVMIILLRHTLLHHLTDDQKKDFFLELRNHLKKNGKIIIGDVAFETYERI